MSESNGYAKPEELFGSLSKTVYKDIELMGHKLQLRSVSAEELQPWLDENEVDNATIKERLIVLVVCKPQFTQEDVAKLKKMHAGFVIKLAEICSNHIDIQSVQSAEKN